MKKIAVVSLAFQHRADFVTASAASIAAQTYPKDQLVWVVVNNPHPEHGSYAPELQRMLVDAPQWNLPQVVILPQGENRGFSEGNNAGIRWALEHGVDAIILLNDDAYFHPECIANMVAACEADPTIGIAQPLILLDPEHDRVNSAGNAVHPLGFSYCDRYRALATDIPRGTPRDVGSISGAVMLLRADLVRQHGMLEEGFSFYHEDVEISQRMRLMGYRAVLIPDAIAYHHYEFSRSIKKYGLAERNRGIVLALHLRLRTLFLIAPLFVVTELVLAVIDARAGRLHDRLSVWQAWLPPSTWRTWAPRRRAIQAVRVVGDRELLRHMTGIIRFEELPPSFALRIANTIFPHILTFLRLVVRW